jgi:hypothetical protein
VLASPNQMTAQPNKAVGNHTARAGAHQHVEDIGDPVRSRLLAMATYIRHNTNIGALRKRSLIAYDH